MNIADTVDYFESMKRTAQKDTDKRAARCIDAIDSALQLIKERKALQNRCYAFTGGTLCLFCNMECTSTTKEGRNGEA